MLRQFTDAVTHQLGAVGRLYRTGGDAFACIVPHAGPDAELRLRVILDRAVQVLRSAAFPAGGVSVGMAHVPADSEVPGNLISIADARMYEDKAGKRRLC